MWLKHLTFVVLLTLAARIASADPAIDAGEERIAKRIVWSSQASVRAALRPSFAARKTFFARLRENNALALWQVIDNKDRELFIGVARDGTLGFHYGFGR